MTGVKPGRNYAPGMRGPATAAEAKSSLFHTRSDRSCEFGAE
jgi:hypothetical protein